MADVNIIKSYLVQLGFQIDNQAQRNFDNVLRLSSQAVAKFTSGAALGFIEFGTAAVSALTAIASGTVFMMNSVAKGDLQMQILARRAYMSLPAFREMKMALDALGVSAEDVIFGPPELRGRYQQLVEDNRRMMAGMGVASFETEMLKIRDIAFQFTRMRQEAQIFVMSLVKDLSIALTGDESGILNRLKGWNEWLIVNTPMLAEKFTTYLVPALRDVKGIWTDVARIAQDFASVGMKFLGDIYDDKRMKSGATNLEAIGYAFDRVSSSIHTMFDWMRKASDFIAAHPFWSKVFGYGAVGAIAGTVIPGAGTVAGGLIGSATGALSYGIDALRGTDAYRGFQAGSMSTQQWQKYAIDRATHYGVDPGLFMAMIDRESAWNPYAKNPKSSATGFGQFLKQNWGMYGGNALDPFQNMDMSAHYLSDLTKKYGSTSEALKHYGPNASQQPAYQDYIMKKREMYNEGIGAGAFGPVTINIYAQTNDPAQHARVVAEELKKQAQRQQIQSTPVFQTP